MQMKCVTMKCVTDLTKTSCIGGNMMEPDKGGYD
jgi:hypothetical protein